MQRLFLLFLIVSILSVSGCSKNNGSDGSTAKDSSWDPLDVFMVHHIKSVHRLHIGVEPYNELIVVYDGENVSVNFSDNMTEQTDGQINAVFEFPESGRLFPQKDYLVFLMKLHAYLTVNPIKRKRLGE